MSGGLSPSLTPNRVFAPRKEHLLWVGQYCPHILSTMPASPSLPHFSFSYPYQDHSLGGTGTPVRQQSLPEFSTNFYSSFFSGYKGHPAGHYRHPGLVVVKDNSF